MKDEISAKEQTIESLNNELKRKDQKISELQETQKETNDALEKISCQLMESKAEEENLLEINRVKILLI